MNILVNRSEEMIMQRMIYETPQMEVIDFEEEDVITTSSDWELPVAPNE